MLYFASVCFAIKYLVYYMSTTHKHLSHWYLHVLHIFKISCLSVTHLFCIICLCSIIKPLICNSLVMKLLLNSHVNKSSKYRTLLYFAGQNVNFYTSILQTFKNSSPPPDSRLLKHFKLD